MRVNDFLVLSLLAVTALSCSKNVHSVSLTPLVTAQESRSVAATADKISFTTHVEPILKSKCQPCHFSGGKVYEKLPFDRPETIKMLGAKLFTRIHDENERKVIREFLSQK
ncbi:MAG TPA: hypothetical protein VLE19_14990 [Pyrinomonadaceae bacterium]|nr:hypothetical protein [Pyrinomonadaceae bacterium]